MQNESSRPAVLITGATGAFGSALATYCAGSGWDTIVLGRNKQKLELLFDRIVKNGGLEPQIVVADFTRLGPADCEELVVAVDDNLGRLDALVHCAANFPGLRPIDQIPPQDWLGEIQVNLNAPWLLSIHCLPLLRKSPRGSLFFLTENMSNMSSAYWGSYGVSKMGLQTLAMQLRAELSNTNIRVHAINPGPMKSSLRARVYHSEDPQWLEPAEIAAKKTFELMSRELVIERLDVNLKKL